MYVYVRKQGTKWMHWLTFRSMWIGFKWLFIIYFLSFSFRSISFYSDSVAPQSVGCCFHTLRYNHIINNNDNQKEEVMIQMKRVHRFYLIIINNTYLVFTIYRSIVSTRILLICKHVLHRWNSIVKQTKEKCLLNSVHTSLEFAQLRTLFCCCHFVPCLFSISNRCRMFNSWNSATSSIKFDKNH